MLARSDALAGNDPLERDILPLLPSRLQQLIREWMLRHPAESRTVSEIRLRSGYPICLCYSGADALLGAEGAAHAGPVAGARGIPAPVSREEVRKTLSLVSNCSYYALESEFANGYVTIPGGHRVGLAGEVALWPDGSVRIREVAGMNFRVARAVPGVAERIAGRLAGPNGACSRP
jgi:stage III sporulation protein AA